MDSAPTDAKRSRALILAVLVLASSTYLFTSMAVIPAFGAIAHALDTDQATVSWLLTAPLLSGAVAPALLGRMADIYGKRRMLIVAMAVFALGGAVAGLGAVNGSLGILIVGRALQGVGASAASLGFGIVRDEFPSEGVGGALSTLSASFGLGSSLGLLLAGPIVTGLSWDWLFWIAALVGLVGLAGTILWVPESPVRRRARLDWLGGLLLSAGLVALLLAIGEGRQWGWSSTPVLSLLLGGVVLLLLLGRWETQTPEPLVDVRLLRRAAVLTSNVEAAAVGFAQFGFMAVLPAFVETPARYGFGFGASTGESGLFMLPSMLAMVAIAPACAAFTRAFGARAALAAGAGLLAAGFVWIAADSQERWAVYGSNAVFGAGLGIAIAAVATLVVQSVRQTQTGAAAGMNMTFRTVGGAIGTQVATVLVGSRTVPGTDVAAQGGYLVTFVVCAAACAAVVLTAALVPRRQPEADQALPTTADATGARTPGKAAGRADV